MNPDTVEEPTLVTTRPPKAPSRTGPPKKGAKNPGLENLPRDGPQTLMTKNYAEGLAGKPKNFASWKGAPQSYKAVMNQAKA